MLVLSRERDEIIKIGDLVDVTVVEIRGDKVRLGINAPKEMSIHRKEVYDAIKREKTVTSHPISNSPIDNEIVHPTDWVSVETRLPTDTEDYQVCGNASQAVAVYRDGHWCLAHNGHRIVFIVKFWKKLGPMPVMS